MIRYQMTGMTPDETGSYIRHHLQLANGAATATCSPRAPSPRSTKQAAASPPGRGGRYTATAVLSAGDPRSGAMMVLRYGLVSGGVAGALAGGEPGAGPGEQGERECGERVLDVVMGGSGLVAGQQRGQVRGGLGQVERPGGCKGDAEDDQCCGDGEGAFRAGACAAMGFSCSGAVVGRGVR